MKLIIKIKFWFTTRRECMWCKPNHYLGGNPFARQITGGMCSHAMKNFLESGYLTQPASALPARKDSPMLLNSTASKPLPLVLIAVLFLLAVLHVGQGTAEAMDCQHCYQVHRSRLTVCLPSAETSLSAIRFSALAQIESGDCDFARGADGEVSRYQILPSQWRACAGNLDPRNPFTARNVAATIASERAIWFAAKFHRPCNDFEFYVLWNAPAQIAHPSRAVAERAQRFANLVSKK